MLVKCVYAFEYSTYLLDDIEVGSVWNTIDNPFEIINGIICLDMITGPSTDTEICISTEVFKKCFEGWDLD